MKREEFYYLRDQFLSLKLTFQRHFLHNRKYSQSTKLLNYSKKNTMIFKIYNILKYSKTYGRILPLCQNKKQFLTLSFQFVDQFRQALEAEDWIAQLTLYLHYSILYIHIYSMWYGGLFLSLSFSLQPQRVMIRLNIKLFILNLFSLK